MERPPHPSGLRRAGRAGRRAALAAAVAAALSLVAVTPAGVSSPAAHAQSRVPDEIPLPAEPSDDPFIRQAQIDRRRAELEAELGALQATNAELQALLDELQRQVDAKAAEVEAARQALEAATAAAERAAAAEAAKAKEVADLEERMRQMAVEVYVSPPSEQRLSVILRGGDLNELNTAMVYFDAKFGMDLDIAERLERARIQLTARRKVAQEAVTEAAARSDEVAAALTELQGIQASQQQVAAVLAERMGELAGEDAAMAEEDAELEAEIDRRREELLAIATRHAGSGGDVPLVVVEGIQVHASVAPALQAMLAAAEADGIVLGGGGFRSFDAQVATRRANCGGDEYSIWHKPAGECSPPTARPGTSLHELGVAIDFTYEGAVISSRTSPAFVWLAEHAEYYGFHNLPSEPWHWSTTGG